MSSLTTTSSTCSINSLSPDLSPIDNGGSVSDTALSPTSFEVLLTCQLRKTEETDDASSSAIPGSWLFPDTTLSRNDAGAIFTHVTRIRRALCFHSSLIDKFHASAIGGLLAREICSLRSAVARNALSAAGELSAYVVVNMEPATATLLLEALAARAINDKRFIRDAALCALSLWISAASRTFEFLWLLSLSGSKSRATALLSADFARR